MSERRGLIDRVLDLPGDDEGDPRAATFVRGLFLGALVGAAIAGSTIWQRRQAKRSEPSVEVATVSHADAARGTPVDRGASGPSSGRSGPSRV